MGLSLSCRGKQCHSSADYLVHTRNCSPWQFHLWVHHPHHNSNHGVWLLLLRLSLMFWTQQFLLLIRTRKHHYTALLEIFCSPNQVLLPQFQIFCIFHLHSTLNFSAQWRHLRKPEFSTSSGLMFNEVNCCILACFIFKSTTSQSKPRRMNSL